MKFGWNIRSQPWCACSHSCPPYMIRQRGWMAIPIVLTGVIKILPSPGNTTNSMDSLVLWGLFGGSGLFCHLWGVALWGWCGGAGGILRFTQDDKGWAQGDGGMGLGWYGWRPWGCVFCTEEGLLAECIWWSGGPGTGSRIESGMTDGGGECFRSGMT